MPEWESSISLRKICVKQRRTLRERIAWARLSERLRTWEWMREASDKDSRRTGKAVKEYRILRENNG